jgi:hypothetical protein
MLNRKVYGMLRSLLVCSFQQRMECAKIQSGGHLLALSSVGLYVSSHRAKLPQNPIVIFDPMPSPPSINMRSVIFISS